MLRDLLIAFSLANLCFIRVWHVLLNPGHHYDHSGFDELVAITLNILLLSTLFWVAITLARRSGKPSLLMLAKGVFLLALIIPLNGIRTALPPAPLTHLIGLIGRKGFMILGVAFLLLTLFVLVRWRHQVIRLAVMAVLVLAPFALLTFSQAVRHSIRYRPIGPAAKTRSLASPDGTAKPRVLWLIFDEMDQRVAFRERPPTVKLPEFDRLRSQSLVANNAYPPAEHTMLSMPALITGKLICNAEAISASELTIKFYDSQVTADWSTQPNIFSRAGEAGLNTAIVGWYHPYCHVLGATLTTCFTEREITGLKHQLVIAFMNYQLHQVLLTFPLVRRFSFQMDTDATTRRKLRMTEYLSVLEPAKKVATDPNFGMILVHLPVPHPPSIFDRTTDAFSLHKKNSYLDGLAAADRTLGELRRAMEDAGMWDNTTILVSSDHWWRTSRWKTHHHSFWTDEDESVSAGGIDHRIPFILKLAVQKDGVLFDAPFNTVLSHDLLLALLKGEVSDPQSVLNWLDEHRTIGDSPCNDR